MNKPSIAELLLASGHTSYTPELVQRAMAKLYGNVGANSDTRDWAAILQSPDPLQAAEDALMAMYQSSSYLLGNTQHLEQSGYVAAQAEITYRQLAERLGFTHQPSWSQGTAYDYLGTLTMEQLVALVPTSPTTPSDSTLPTIISVAITAASGVQNDTLNAGDVLSVTVTMSEATTVTTTGGTPQLALDIGGTTVQASYASGSGSTALVFTYTLQAGQTDANGIAIAANSLGANGGTLQDAAGNHATLAHGAVADNASYRVDTTAPVATLASMVQLEPPGVTSGYDYYPQIAAVGSGGAFVVTWYGQDSVGGDNSIFVQKFNADGTTGAGPVQLEPTGVTTGGDYSPQIAAVGSSGAFVVTWRGHDSAGGDYSIYVQKFNADGTTTGQATVQLEAIGKSNGDDREPQITAVGSSGEFVVTWYGEDSAGDTSIFVQKFNADGTTGAGPVQLEPTGVTNGGDFSPQIAAVGSSGAFVVTWQGQDSAGGQYNIFVQKFNADGTTGAGPVRLEPPGVTPGNDYSPQVVAVGSGGAFVVTWYGQDSVGGDNSIFVQKFNADGTTGAGLVRLEPPGVTNGNDVNSQIAAVGSSGAFVVTWHGQDSAGDYSIFVQKFDADGQPVPGAVLVNPGMPVYVRSSEAGTAYLVQSSVTATTLADITSAADALWNQVAITAANTDTPLPTTGLGDGTYRLYMADAAGNLSASSGTVTVAGAAPWAHSFTATATAVGATSTESGTLGLYDASHQLLAKTGGGTFSAPMAVTGGQNDTITGGEGGDYLTGGAGNDTLAGGDGIDTFTFVAGVSASAADVLAANGTDILNDFSTDDVLGVVGLLGGTAEVFVGGDGASVNQSGTANVIVITDNFAQGSTMINQDVDTIFSEVGSHNGSGVMVFNNNGVVQVWYDSNVGLDQNGDGVTLLGTITTGSAAADLASLTAAHFA